ncbi:leucyl aminopeptidase [Roseibium limicola]|uniref:Probable cytosol aminopeptidase n=1 Tax=Roseibium limicola TaxID=2816037 RepID=A0A939EP55_9HYPH|nr:leucyl aminopeptidase [Roseibium limicola]MBO0346181.1 leucyl aminopeptidase [Roseibium limicola]
MAQLTKVSFAKVSAPEKGTAVVLATDEMAMGATTSELLGRLSSGLEKIAAIGGFTGKKGSILELIAPAGLELDRLVVLGLGKPQELNEEDWLGLGGKLQAALAKAKVETASLLFEAAGLEGETGTSAAAKLAMGAKLASYTFDTYKSAKPDDDKPTALKLEISIEDHKATRKVWDDLDGISDGVLLARELVNEPPNVLGPVEFAAKAKELEKLGVEVEILTEKEMTKLKMGALLGVAQGSVRPPRLAVMKWNGGKKSDAPLAFVGKGVVFDTGGISIKPAGGMEDMKGDMGGAAAVTGLMHALAARKARVNAVGVIGLVENMPDGNAYRPGDILTAMSGTTIEVLNTDAEGRLVLADALWYTQEKFTPVFMIDLATLTGAVLVALGHLMAGMFTEDDELAERLTAAGKSSGEPVWRLPVSKDYDKLIDTPNADVKNTGGRTAGSITAAQFLLRFSNGVPHVHLDVAGTAFGAGKTDINTGWASGYGVRLLDRFVADFYES